MPRFTTVSFEEIPVIFGGAPFWASGEVDISYKTLRGDRDIGEPDRYVEIDFPAEMNMTLFDEDDEPVLEILAQSTEDLFRSVCHQIGGIAKRAAEEDAWG
jgi:hypothetical protein